MGTPQSLSAASTSPAPHPTRLLCGSDECVKEQCLVHDGASKTDVQELRSHTHPLPRGQSISPALVTILNLTPDEQVCGCGWAGGRAPMPSETFDLCHLIYVLPTAL